MMGRTPISKESRDLAVRAVSLLMENRLAEKGDGAFASRHEILGIVTEEYAELIDAVHRGGPSEINLELLDLAVAAVLGIACIYDRSLDW